MALNPKVLDGPIPGENYTSDTRNYPWHRPPEYTDVNEAVEWSIQKLTSDEAVHGLLTLIQAGLPIATATDMFVTSGIGQGKWTPDFAILIAGPVFRTIKLIAMGANIDFEEGLEESPIMTFEYLKAVNSPLNEEMTDLVAEEAQQALLGGGTELQGSGPPKKMGGFMGMGPSGPAPQETQQSMLGMGEEL